MTRAASTAPQPLLVVPLASFTDRQQKTLMSRIQRFLGSWPKAEIWKLKTRSLHTPIAPRSNYFPQCNPDSKAHIHELAILLHRLGHSKFLAADGLTLRQLTNDCRYGEEEVLSVVLVNIKSSPEKKGIKSYFQSLSPLVFAERRIIETENQSGAESYSDSDETWEDDMGSSEEWSDTDTPDEDRDDDDVSFRDDLIMGHPRITIDMASKSTQQILDADRELFTMPTVLSTGRWKFENEVASALPNCLPQELKAEIVSYLDHRNTDRNSLGGWDLEWWPGRLDSEHPMVILLAFPTTASQLQRLRNAMAQYMKKIFEIITLQYPPLSERHEILKWTIQLLIRRSQYTPEERYGFSSPQEEESDDFSNRREEELPLDQFHVQLVPWPYNQPATRRDLEYHYRRARCFARHYLLRCPFSTSSDEDLLENSELATLQAYIPRDMAIHLPGKLPSQIVHAVRKSFAGIVREELLKAIQWNDLEPLKPKRFPLYQMICKETLRDPDQPLYDNPPPWNSIRNMDFALARSRFPALPLFYLTKRFSDEDLHGLEDTLWNGFQIVPPRWRPLEILHIPWVKGDNADGTVHDIWNMLWEITSQMSEDYLTPLFFVDNQTRFDGTLIVVDEWEIDETDFQAGHGDLLRGIKSPLVRGMLYGRIHLDDACSFNKSVNDEWETKTFEQELVSGGIDVMHRYLRPDWPGHGIIPISKGKAGNQGNSFDHSVFT